MDCEQIISRLASNFALVFEILNDVLEYSDKIDIQAN
jgi:hypothetical protein